jgi:hypothetical protein
LVPETLVAANWLGALNFISCINASVSTGLGLVGDTDDFLQLANAKTENSIIIKRYLKPRML